MSIPGLSGRHFTMYVLYVITGPLDLTASHVYHQHHMPNNIGVIGLQSSFLVVRRVHLRWVPQSQTQYPEPTDERELSNEDASQRNRVLRYWFRRGTRGLGIDRDSASILPFYCYWWWAPRWLVWLLHVGAECSGG